MTWRDAIRRAVEAVEYANADRTRILRAAHEAGVSTRQIAEAAGVSPATAWRWVVKDNGSAVSLDSEVDDA